MSRRVTVQRVIGPVLSWESQACQYAYRGEPGIRLERHSLGELRSPEFTQSDCLLYRDERGLLVGILNHYCDDNKPLEQAGIVNLWVKPDHQGKGVGTALLREAMRRWKIDLEQQRYTTEGLWFVNGLLRKRERGEL